MPELWRAPTPMVRMTAPQITAIQKLRSGGALAARDAGRGLDDETGRSCEEGERASGNVLQCKFQVPRSLRCRRRGAEIAGRDVAQHLYLATVDCATAKPSLSSSP